MKNSDQLEDAFVDSGSSPPHGAVVNSAPTNPHHVQSLVGCKVFVAASAEEFLKKRYPPKEPLAENLLYRRDLVAFGARRRHGKTTLLTNLRPSRDLAALAEAAYRRFELGKVVRVLGALLPPQYFDSHERLIGQIRQAVRTGKFLQALAWLGRDAGRVFLETAWSRVPSSKRVECLTYAWEEEFFGGHPLRARQMDALVVQMFRSTPKMQKLPAGTGSAKVYRGVAAASLSAARRAVRRPSWTLRQDVALWFADRYQKLPLGLQGFLAEGVIRADAVLAYFGPGEAEVVVDPAGLVRGSVVVRPLTQADAADIQRYDKEIEKSAEEMQHALAARNRKKASKRGRSR